MWFPAWISFQLELQPACSKLLRENELLVQNLLIPKLFDSQEQQKKEVVWQTDCRNLIPGQVEGSKDPPTHSKRSCPESTPKKRIPHKPYAWLGLHHKPLARPFSYLLSYSWCSIQYVNTWNMEFCSSAAIETSGHNNQFQVINSRSKLVKWQNEYQCWKAQVPAAGMTLMTVVSRNTNRHKHPNRQGKIEAKTKVYLI